MPVTIKTNSGGGSVTLDSGSSALDTTLTLPNTNGTILAPASGVLAASQGGTGAATLTANNVLLGNGTSAVQVVAPSTSGNVLTSNGTTWISSAPTSGITSGTAVSASGTAVDFTGIPSTAKQITVMYSGLSTNGSAALQIQLFATSLVSTGYLGYSVRNGGANVYTAFSSAFVLSDTITSSDIYYGSDTISLLGSNTWVATGMMTSTRTTAISSYIAGSVSLGATLTGIRITTTNGTDTFDSGTINILYQ